MTGHYIVKLNNKCNANCCFCADSPIIRKQGDFDYDALIKELELNRKKYDSLIISGGEPTIYPRLIEYIRYAKEECRYEHIALTTNGLMLSYKSFCDALLQAGVDSFIISFASEDIKKYYAITKVKNSLKLVTKGIKYLKIKKREVRINTVVHKINYMNLYVLVEYLIRLKVDSIQLSFMNPVGSGCYKGKYLLAVRYNELMPYIEKAFEVATKHNYSSLFIENIPVCVAPKFEERISDFRKPAENKKYYNSNKIKPEKCKTCTYFGKCDGVWEAYLKGYGDEELVIIKKRELAKAFDTLQINAAYRESNNQQYSLFSKEAHSLEPENLVGLEIGIRKAAIFYYTKNTLLTFIELLNKKGYQYSISDFAYNYFGTHTEITSKPNENSAFSIYVSRDNNICERLKKIDYVHQFKLSLENSKSIFFEIGELLGYPKCCSKALITIEKNNAICKKEGLGVLFDYETIYPIKIYEKSWIKDYHLNNFNKNCFHLIDFYVCSYSCENALRIAKNIEKYYITNTNMQTGFIERVLKLPILFFTPRKNFYFPEIEFENEKIVYDNSLIGATGLKKDNDNLTELYASFKKGTSFSTTPLHILVYKDNSVIYTYRKKHKYEGLFINFNN